MTLAELEKRRAELAAEAQALIDAADNDKNEEGKSRDLTDDESERSEKIHEECATLDKQIDVRRKTEALQVTMRKVKPFAPIDPLDDGDETRETKETAEFAIPIRQRSSIYKDDKDAYLVGRWLRNSVLCDPRFPVPETEIRFLRHHGIELRVMTEDVNTAGGYTVPEILLSRMIELRNERGVFRANAEVVPMGTDLVRIPRRTGGVTAFAIGETDSITASQASFDQVVLAPQKWGVLTRISSDLNEDAIIGIADFLTREIAFAFADKEDECGFNGDGTSTFAGCFGLTIKIIDGNHSASVFQAGANDNTWGELVLADYESTIALLPDYATAASKWYISQTGYYLSMAPILNAGGGNTIDVLERGVSRRMFLGFPVVFTDVLLKGTSTTNHASKVACALGDLRLGAKLGDRRGMTLKQDASRYLEFDQIAIQATTRFDINVHELGDTSTAGALVALQFNTA